MVGKNSGRKVSIILPTYNSMGTLKESVESVLSQTYKNFELVIIDDGSTDETPDYLKQLKGNKKVKIITQENQGACKARNEGVRNSGGDFLFFHDSDMIMYPNLIEKEVKALKENPEASYAYSDYATRIKEGSWRKPIFKSRPFNADELRKMNYIPGSALIRREHFPGWDPKIKGLQDWDLWLTMLDNGYTGVYVPEILFETIDREESITQSWVRDHYSEAYASVLAKHKKIAIFTLTKDRLEYTRRMFEALDKHTHISYDHFIVDQGSTDGTSEYLKKLMEERKNLHVIFNEDNKGISIGSNQALDVIGDKYDYIMKLDNDCEVLSDNWLYELVKLMIMSNNVFVLSPRVEGIGTKVPRFASCTLGGHKLGITLHLGGISVIAPREAYNSFRWNEGDPLSGFQDAVFSQHSISKGYLLAYVEDLRVMHMDTTGGQESKYPKYLEEKINIQMKMSYKEYKESMERKRKKRG